MKVTVSLVNCILREEICVNTLFFHREAHECVEASLLPVLRVLFNAPVSSPFAAVNVANVAELIVSVTAPAIVLKADLTTLGINQDKKWVTTLRVAYRA